MSDWQPGNTAPKDGRMVLVFGQPSNIEGMTYTGPGIHTAYYDAIDGTFCVSGSTWLGPFVEPIKWMELPAKPEAKY